MTKLNDLQSILLAHAAQRDGGSLYPVPDSTAAAGARLPKAVAALIKAGLAEERETSDAGSACRTAGDLGSACSSRRLALRRSAWTTRRVVGRSGSARRAANCQPGYPHQQDERGDRPATARGWATMPELIEATGWLPHTTRAALTGLRKKGHAVDRVTRDGVTCYRIVAGAAVAAAAA